MASQAQNDPILKRFRAALNEIYGNRIDRVVLFGSRARGDAQPDSDWDVAVFLRGGAGFAELKALSSTTYDLLLETGQFIQPLALPVEREGEDSLLMGSIRRDGVVV